MGVIVGEPVRSAHPEAEGALKRVGRDDPACDLFGAVDSVGIPGDRPGLRLAPQSDRERQQELDVATAASNRRRRKARAEASSMASSLAGASAGPRSY
jgi:hypothetical protein